jgi:hypothetical protein
VTLDLDVKLYIASLLYRDLLNSPEPVLLSAPKYGTELEAKRIEEVRNNVPDPEEKFGDLVERKFTEIGASVQQFFQELGGSNLFELDCYFYYVFCVCHFINCLDPIVSHLLGNLNSSS